MAVTTGRNTGFESTLLNTYHRSSGGMRLVRDLSSSAASRESSVEGESSQGVCLALRSWDLVAKLEDLGRE